MILMDASNTNPNPFLIWHHQTDNILCQIVDYCYRE
jgi:hypothetical protein